MDGLRVIPVSNMELVYSVTAVADEIWHEHFVPIIGEEQVDYMLEKFLSPEALVEQINSGYRYYLFSFEYTFAGFAGVHKENGSLFLSKLYVHKDFRGKKIASHMLQKFIEICKLRELKKIWLTCNRNNTTTLAVYEHLGFLKVREEVSDIGNGYVMDDYILEYNVK
jgi:ribosomal protein S18 acetylase RimI-like enzyme